MSSIFHARKLTGSSDSPDTPSPVAEPVITEPAASRELTRNEKFCVTRLPALPAAFHHQPFQHGYADQTTSHAVVVLETCVCVWDYTSVDGIPLMVSFPVTPNPNNTLPLAVLVSPSAGSTDPGLVIIDSYSGRVKYYEAITAAPALGIINSKSIEYDLGLGESFYMVENVEPAGVMVASTTGRVALVALRDSQGRPSLLATNVVRTPSALFGWGKPDTVVAMRRGSVLAGGTREVAVQYQSGTLRRFACSRSAVHALSSLGLAAPCVSALEGYVPGTELDLQFLDLRLMSEAPGLQRYLVLASTTSPYETDARAYIVFAVRADATGAVVTASHRLRSHSSRGPERARLYLPQPCTTAFVVIGSTVILTAVEGSPHGKWEDLVTLRDTVGVLGAGAENVQFSRTGRISRNTGLVLLTTNAGVLRVERFPSEDAAEAPVESPERFVQTHIEQAVHFHAEESPLDFSYRCGVAVPATAFESAVATVATEILSSASQHVPAFAPLLKEHLQKRLAALLRLVRYVAANFPLLSIDTKLATVASLEQAAVGLALWVFVEARPEACLLLEVGPQEPHEPHALSAAGDPIRAFFMTGLGRVNGVLSRFLTAAAARKLDVSGLVESVVSAVYEIEQEYRFGVLGLQPTEVGSSAMWVFQTRLVFQIDQVLEGTVAAYRNREPVAGDEPGQAARRLEALATALFYLFDNALTFMRVRQLRPDTMLEYAGYYEERKPAWTAALVEFAAVPAALRLAEQYHDYTSLAVICDSQCPQRFEPYFETFGYPFAQAVYTLYLHQDRPQTLLTAFPRHFRHLRRFLAEGNYGKLAWVRDVLDGRFAEAAVAAVSEGDPSPAHRKLQLSVAKLALLAAEDPETETVYASTSRELELVALQQALHRQLAAVLPGHSVAGDVDFVMATHTSHTGVWAALLRKALAPVVAGRAATVAELVDCFTLLDARPAAASRENFVCAFKAVALRPYASVEDKRLAERLVWSRLLVVDDWETLTATAHKTDEYVKQSFEATVFYTTMKHVLNNEVVAAIVDFDRLVSGQAFETEVSLSAIQTRYVGEDALALQAAISEQEAAVRQRGLDPWIRSLVETIRASDAMETNP